jgi:hypothetical protein
VDLNCFFSAWYTFLAYVFDKQFHKFDHFILFSSKNKSNNSGTAKVKIVKNERDPSLFTGKLLIKFQNILRNATQVFSECFEILSAAYR